MSIRILPPTRNASKHFARPQVECPVEHRLGPPVRTLILPTVVQGPRGPMRGYVRATYGDSLHVSVTRAEFKHHRDALGTSPKPPARFSELLRNARSPRAA